MLTSQDRQTVSSPQRRSASRLMAIAVGASLVFGLAACGDADREAAQSGSTNGDSPATPTSPDTDPDTEHSDEDAGDPAHSSGTACLVGTWLTDNDNVGAVLQRGAGDVNVSAPTGAVFLTFSEGGPYSVNYQTWTFEMSHEGTKVEVVRDGVDTGSYQATDDGRLTTTETDMGSVVSMTSPAGTHSTTGEPSGMTGTFTCEGTTLEITVDGETSILSRQ